MQISLFATGGVKKWLVLQQRCELLMRERGRVLCYDPTIHWLGKKPARKAWSKNAPVRTRNLQSVLLLLLMASRSSKSRLMPSSSLPGLGDRESWVIKRWFQLGVGHAGKLRLTRTIAKRLFPRLCTYNYFSGHLRFTKKSFTTTS